MKQYIESAGRGHPRPFNHDTVQRLGWQCRNDCGYLYWNWPARQRGKVIKGWLIRLLFLSPDPSFSLQDYHNPDQLFFTTMMMLSKHLVSLVAGLAAVTSVAALIPAPGGAQSQGGSSPALTSTTPQCDGTLLCCTTLASASDPSAIKGAQDKGITIVAGLGIGSGCYKLATGDKW
jgi:hypothetical protein